MTTFYQHYGTPDPGLSVQSVTPGYLSLVVQFSAGMFNDTELNDPTNYTFDVTTPESSVDISCITVTPEDATNPTYVTLTISDCTDGAEYTLVIAPNTLRNANGDYLAAGANTATFNGVTVAPEILSVVAVSSTQMRVSFSKTMSINDDLKDPSRYSFTDSLRVISVEIENSSSVLLTTSEQTTAHIYTLTVS